MPSTNGHGSSGATERVALYLRVSSEEQRDKETIKTQRAELENYCRLHGLEVVGEYADDGVSGTISLHEGPAGRTLPEDARAGTFDSVACYKLDRVGRTLLNVVDAHDRLEALGVGLRSAKEQVESTTLAGRLQFQMLAGFAEFERGTIRERTQDGLHRAFRAGEQSGMILYGYDIRDDDGTFVVVKDEARVVREIISNVASGSTLYQEVRRLNTEGIPHRGESTADVRASTDPLGAIQACEA
jgi:site-specific DNA recombinase